MITAELKNQILYISLNHQSKSGAFNLEDAKSIEFEIYKKNKQAKAFMFRSEHSHFFCTGGDLKFYAAQKRKNLGILTNAKITKILNKIYNDPRPKVAIIEGDCYGGGLELLSIFNFRICTVESQFGFWQRRIGLTLGWGGGSRWSNTIPLETLKILLYESKSFSSYEAKNLGIIHQIVPKSFINQVAETWVQKSFNLPQYPAKALIKLNSKNEKSIFDKIWWNPEHKNALKKYH